MTLTIAIPTYNRGAILVETITRLLGLTPRGDAILIADQTKQHPPEVEAQLRAWHDEGAIRWMRLEDPSIPKAMNDALIAAKTDLVLFFDDDIIPAANIAGEHVAAHRNECCSREKFRSDGRKRREHPISSSSSTARAERSSRT
jgi:glycosyltransferase involved in cell wall biosynthesis